MVRSILALLLLFAGSGMCFAGEEPSASAPEHAFEEAADCDLDPGTALWIGSWLDAWELVAEEILDLGPASPPELVFYDQTCLWTTAEASAPDSRIVPGPELGDQPLPWRATPHHGTLTLPDGAEVPLGLMSFASPYGEGKKFFVMAAPSFWREAGVDSKELGLDNLIAGVFLHEFSHTRQIDGFQKIIGPIEDRWAFPEELTDDVVQDRFGKDPDYVVAYEAERDKLIQAAKASSPSSARALAEEALALMNARRSRWFVGEDEPFAQLDDAFLSFEGAGQWAGYAWLVHPEGGDLAEETAWVGFRRGGRFWSQDEGLALFLVVDRLLPDWPALAFGPRPAGALELLTRAVRKTDGSRDPSR